jgi:hypothetical protein
VTKVLKAKKVRMEHRVLKAKQESTVKTGHRDHKDLKVHRVKPENRDLKAKRVKMEPKDHKEKRELTAKMVLKDLRVSRAAKVL